MGKRKIGFHLTDEEENQNESPDGTDDIKSFLLEKFEPVSVQDAELYLTTQELFENLQAHMPGKYSRSKLAGLLKEAGFNVTTTGPAQYAWCLKMK